MADSYLLLAVIASLAWVTFAAAAVPITEPTAPSLIREVQQSELWFDQLTSFHMKLEGTSADTTTRPSGYAVELAFAPGRLRNHIQWPGTDYLRLWDSQRQTDRQSTNGGPAAYVILDHPQMGESLMIHLNWGRLASHRFWWISDGAYNAAGTPIDPDDYTLAGQQTFRGTPCYVLTSQTRAMTHYVGVADHRLYGTDVRAPSHADMPKISAATLAAVNAQFNQSFKTQTQLEAWRDKLPADQRRLADRVWREVIITHARPYIEQWLSDYRELAPGRWFPMKQGSRIHALDDIPERAPWEQAVTLVELDPKLDDSLFTAAEIPDGARVDDMIRNLTYTQKHDRTPAEWQKLTDDRAKIDAQLNASTAAMDALVGHPAPAFPKGAEWINAGKPLTWSDLKSKVVLLDFFAESCGPCRNDLPTLADLHAHTNDTGITILALHPAGGDRANLDKLLKEFHLAYPICLDTFDPADPDAAWGTAYAQYHVDAIPHTVVIDKQGRIAAHGDLARTLPVARRLAGE